MKDLLYYFDKTTFVRNELGEIQDSFNMSFVIDGTKDSCKANVYSYIKTKITPKTICYHLGTQTWWIVSNDKVSRFENENGYLYIHELQLEGAIELLNARDLTDSGFNANRYSVYDFINRLFRLSNFEYDIQINYNNNIASDKTIDYIKTFENYTLLSALREFLDGYNCVAKLSFATKTEDDEILLDYAIIDILSKTGNSNVVSRNSDEVFNDIREITNTNKSNYGTSVISNAENVVSTKTKTYPSIGSGIKLGNNSNVATNGSNAILRLPTNVFKAHYIDIYGTKVPYGYVYNGGKTTISYVDLSNKSSIDNAYNEVISTLHSLYPDFDSSVFTKDLFYKHFIRVYYCDNYNAVSDTFITQNRTAIVRLDQGSPNVEKSLVLCSEELKNSLTYPKQAICFNRGKDYISGFGCFDYQSDTEMRVIYFTKDEVCQEAVYQNYYLYMFVGDIDIDNATGEVSPASNESYEIKYTAYSVNYTPMTDIKIKMDNDGDTIDSDLYNQNGKLNDSNSLSKVLLSYVKEIESDTITKYGTYYGAYVDTLGFQSGGLPNVGDLIKVNNDLYVINNISIDFTPNESTTWLVDSIGYYMVAEVSMSKKVATKSLLTSPNTNIRDYGIPQNNNVKRKQLYRDFYEFTYTKESNKHNWYLPLGKVLNLSNQPQEYKEHIAVIHTIFNDNVNGHKDYYYQLETTTYFLKKSLYEITDFKDNNIIGYGYQNLWSGFDISKIFFSGNDGNYNTPISYVDDNGEVSSVLIKMSTIDYLQDSYLHLDTYDTTKTYNTGDKVYRGGKVYTCNTDNTTGTWNSSKWTDDGYYSIYNASVFIPQGIYDYLNARPKYDFKIEEPNYKKDALEVPLFEYSCQVDDTENVIVGENILDSGDNDVAYLYSFILIDESLYNDNNYMLLSDYIPNINVNNQNVATHNNAVVFDTTHIRDEGQNTPPYFKVKLYESESIDIDDNVQPTYGNVVPLVASDLEGKTLLVIRHNLTQDDLYTNVVGELALNSVQASLPTANASIRNKIVVLDDGTYALCIPDPYTFTLSTDAHSIVEYYKIKREGITIVDSSLGQSDSITENVVQDDTYELNCYADSGYYINGANYRSGTIDKGIVSISITTLKYLIVTITKDNNVRSVTGSISGQSFSLTTSNTYTYSESKPNDLVSYRAEAINENYYIPNAIVNGLVINADTTINIKSYYIVGESIFSDTYSGTPTATSAREGKYYVSTSGFYYKCIRVSATYGTLQNSNVYENANDMSSVNSPMGVYIACKGAYNPTTWDRTIASTSIYKLSNGTSSFPTGSQYNGQYFIVHHDTSNSYPWAVYPEASGIRYTFVVSSGHPSAVSSARLNITYGGTTQTLYNGNSLYVSKGDISASMYFIGILSTSSYGSVSAYIKVEVMINSTTPMSTTYFDATQTSDFTIEGGGTFTITQYQNPTIYNQLTKPADGKYWWYIVSGNSYLRIETATTEQNCRLQTTDAIYKWYANQTPPYFSRYYLYDYFLYVGQGGRGNWQQTSVKLDEDLDQNDTFNIGSQNYYWNDSQNKWEETVSYTWSSGTNANGCAFTYNGNKYYYDNGHLH